MAIAIIQISARDTYNFSSCENGVPARGSNCLLSVNLLLK